MIVMGQYYIFKNFKYKSSSFINKTTIKYKISLNTFTEMHGKNL